MGLALAAATSLFLLCVLVPTMAGSPLADASPYSGERPKRVYIQHISRAYFDDKIAPVGEKFDLLTSPAAHHRDHGAWANAMDYLNMEPLAKVDMGLGAASASSDPCDSVPSRLQRSLLCDMPWYFPISEMIQGGRYYPTSVPTTAAGATLAASLEVRSAAFDAQRGRRRVSLRMEGPDHMVVVIDAATVPSLTWSLGEGVEPRWRPDCNCYWVFYSVGGPHAAAISEQRKTAAGRKEAPQSNTWDLWKEYEGEVPAGIAFYAQEIEMTSTKIDAAFTALPEWTTSIGWISAWSRWKV